MAKKKPRPRAEATVSASRRRRDRRSHRRRRSARGVGRSRLRRQPERRRGRRRLPRPVLDAWQANKTLVLLFVRDGGIDDRLVKTATDGLAGFRDAAIFVVPAAKISRYAAITEGVGVDRVPALVVVTPKHLKKTVPTASVSYGFQSPQSVAQAVIDAGYKGPTLDYHP